MEIVNIKKTCSVLGQIVASVLFGMVIFTSCPAFAQYGNGNGAMPFVAPAPAVPVSPPPGSLFSIANTYAADVLHSMLVSRLNFAAPVLVASMVDLNNLDATSDMGRLATQQIASRLSQYGLRIVDVRLRKDMVVRQEGEFLLSRNAAKLMQAYYNAKAAIVGAYSVSEENVYLSVRAINLVDGSVLAGYEYFLPYRGEVKALLSSSSVFDRDALWGRYAKRGASFGVR